MQSRSAELLLIRINSFFIIKRDIRTEFVEYPFEEKRKEESYERKPHEDHAAHCNRSGFDEQIDQTAGKDHKHNSGRQVSDSKKDRILEKLWNSLMKPGEQRE